VIAHHHEFRICARSLMAHSVAFLKIQCLVANAGTTDIVTHVIRASLTNPETKGSRHEEHRYAICDDSPDPLLGRSRRSCQRAMRSWLQRMVANHFAMKNASAGPSAMSNKALRLMARARTLKHGFIAPTCRSRIAVSKDDQTL
jgi:hypothetical protein